MTREEAIKQLDTMWKMLTSAYDDIADSHVVAYTMAVDALKAQGTCEDAVSRQTLQKELALYPIDDVTSEDEAGYNRAINDVQKMVLHLPSAQPEPLKITIDPPTADELERIKQAMRITPVIFFPSAQPEPSEITDEQAIMHLQSTGWMQNHDREMYESGLRERLADDSDSYDALLPSAQPEEDCDTCKHGYFGDDKCNNCRVRYPSHYERITDEQTD